MASYSQQEQAILREGGKRLADIMAKLSSFVVPGKQVHEIEMRVRDLIAQVGATSATIGYRIPGASTAFTSAACVSVNDEVVHGIAYNNKRVLQEGDVVSVDVVIRYQGLFVDICRTYGAGKLSEEDTQLVRTARQATDHAIAQALAGNTVDDIGRAAEEVARAQGMSTARELGGHGVGKKIHTSPFIPNFAGSGFRDKIQEGMVLAIEPIVCVGDWRIKEESDGWTLSTIDGSKAAQFEETVLITNRGPEILTTV